MIHLKHKWNISLSPLIWGFCISVALTMAAYFFVTEADASPITTSTVVICLGTLQALFQLVLFFQLGVGAEPRWGLILVAFSVFIAALVLGGSLWIMANLDYNVMIN